MSNAHAPQSPARHTPGPWTVDDGAVTQHDMIDNLAADLEQSDREWGAILANGECVAYTHPSNARLIASAPDLLAALRGCISAYACNNPERMAVEIANAHAAIERATRGKA